MEQLGGVSALRVDGKASEDSQISERDKIIENHTLQQRKEPIIERR